MTHDEFTPRERDEIWWRSDVLETAKIAVAVIDNENRPEALRVEAQRIFEQCSNVLLYTNDPKRHLVMVPAGFHIADFYRDMWVDFLRRMPDLTDESYKYPIFVAVGEQAARNVDNDAYSVDFRMECLESFNYILQVLEAEAQQHLSVVD
jgi:hypothetical protein